MKKNPKTKGNSQLICSLLLSHSAKWRSGLLLLRPESRWFFQLFFVIVIHFKLKKTFQKWNHTANAMSEGLKLNDPKPKYNFDAFETTPRSFVSTMKAKSNLRIEKHESWQKRNRDSSVLSYPRLWAWSLRIKGDFFGANAKEKKLAWTTNKLKTYLKLRQWDLWYITKRRICIKVLRVWKNLLLA